MDYVFTVPLLVGDSGLALTLFLLLMAAMFLVWIWKFVASLIVGG